MTQISQTSFASRLARAEKLHTILLTFTDYDSGEGDLTAEALLTIITNLKDTQSKHATSQHQFSEAVKQRLDLYLKNPVSISKTITLVKNYVKGKYKKESQEYASIETLVNKIRGEKPVTINKNSTEETISQSEKSYGAQLTNLTDLVTLIEGFEGYKPANANIKLPQLQTLKDQAILSNNTVTEKFAVFKPKIKERQTGFNALSDTAGRIKNMVMSQYGNNSPQYNLIKGLEFTKS